MLHTRMSVLAICLMAVALAPANITPGFLPHLPAAHAQSSTATLSGTFMATTFENTGDHGQNWLSALTFDGASSGGGSGTVTGSGTLELLVGADGSPGDGTQLPLTYTIAADGRTDIAITADGETDTFTGQTDPDGNRFFLVYDDVQDGERGLVFGVKTSQDNSASASLLSGHYTFVQFETREESPFDTKGGNHILDIEFDGNGGGTASVLVSSEYPETIGSQFDITYEVHADGRATLILNPLDPIEYTGTVSANGETAAFVSYESSSGGEIMIGTPSGAASASADGEYLVALYDDTGSTTGGSHYLASYDLEASGSGELTLLIDVDDPGSVGIMLPFTYTVSNEGFYSVIVPVGTYADAFSGQLSADGSFFIQSYVDVQTEGGTEDSEQGFIVGLRKANTATATKREQPARFHLGPAYPNPFSQSTTFTFSLDQPIRVTLDVHDVLGRPVARLMDDALPAGPQPAVG